MKAFIRAFFALTILMSSLAGLPTDTLAKQSESETTWTFESSGATLDIGESGEAYIDRDGPFYSEDTNGSIAEGAWLQKGNSEIGITFLTTDRDHDQLIETYIQVDNDPRLLQYTVLGQVSDANETWHLAEYSQYHGQYFYEYQHFIWDAGGTYHILIEVFSGYENIEEDVTWLQDNVTIDGDPILADADLLEVNNLLNGNSDLESWEVFTFSSDVADWSDQGLVSDSEWYDAEFDSTVTWDTNHLRFPLESQIAIEFIDENESSTLSLTTLDSGGNIYITSMTNPEGRSISEWAERWTSEGILTTTGNLWPAVGIKETETSISVVLTKVPRYDQELVTIRQGILTPDNTIVMLTIVVPPDQAEAVYYDLINHLQFNGSSIEPLWTPEELQEFFPNTDTQSSEITRSSRSSQEAESAPETQQDRTSRSSRADSTPEADDQDWTELGLVSDTEWQSPVSGTSFTWDASTFVFPSEDADAISTDTDYAQVSLRTTDGRGEITLATDMGGFSLDLWYETMLSDGWLASLEQDGMDVEILDSYADGTTASVIYLYHADEGDFVVILDIFEADDGTTVITEIMATPKDIATVYQAVWDGVQADGEFYPFTWSLEDIENLEID